MDVDYGLVFIFCSVAFHQGTGTGGVRVCGEDSWKLRLWGYRSRSRRHQPDLRCRDLGDPLRSEEVHLW